MKIEDIDIYIRGSDEKAKETNERTGKAKEVVVAGVAVVQRLSGYFGVNLHRGHPDKDSFASGQIIVHCQSLMLWRCSRRPL